MLISMTGYGQASADVDDIRYSLEIKSLNGKYFKSVIKLPEILGAHEPKVEQILRNRLVRGSIGYVLRIKDLSERAAWDVNASAVRGYVKALKEIAGDTQEGAAIRIDLSGVLSLPGVCQMPEQDPAELAKRWEIIEKLTHQALDQVIAMRTEEGIALKQDLETHLQRIADALEKIRERTPLVVTDYAERLRNRVQNLMTEVEVQLREEDLAREIAIFAERADINEEVSRLTSHLQQFGRVMEEENNSGRKLEFLAQEMLRETNTIGSKANDAEIATHVVEIKGHIDRIKEQVLNVV